MLVIVPRHVLQAVFRRIAAVKPAQPRAELDRHAAVSADRARRISKALARGRARQSVYVPLRERLPAVSPLSTTLHLPTVSTPTGSVTSPQQEAKCEPHWQSAFAHEAFAMMQRVQGAGQGSSPEGGHVRHLRSSAEARVASPLPSIHSPLGTPPAAGLSTGASATGQRTESGLLPVISPGAGAVSSGPLGQGQHVSSGPSTSSSRSVDAGIIEDMDASPLDFDSCVSCDSQEGGLARRGLQQFAPASGAAQEGLGGRRPRSARRSAGRQGEAGGEQGDAHDHGSASPKTPSKRLDVGRAQTSGVRDTVDGSAQRDDSASGAPRQDKTAPREFKTIPRPGPDFTPSAGEKLCGHHCQLGFTLKCCVCSDQRGWEEKYLLYVDGVGDVAGHERGDHYCPPCGAMWVERELVVWEDEAGAVAESLRNARATKATPLPAASAAEPKPTASSVASEPEVEMGAALASLFGDDSDAFESD